MFLAGCSKSDRELMNGKWSVQEVKANGETMFTTDKATQAKVVDRFVSQQMAQMPPEAQAQAAMMKEMFAKQMDVIGKTTIEIKEDGSFISTRYEGEKAVESKGKMTLDEKKKEVTMKSDTEEKFKYELKDDSMKLSSVTGNDKLELTFKRK